MTRARAFTLIEVLIMIVVGLIVAAAAVPSFVSLDDQRVIAAAHVLESDLEFARARAIGVSYTHRISFDVANEDYTVESPPGTLLLEPLSHESWRRELSKDSIDIVSATFGVVQSVSFDAAGRPSVGGRVILRKKGFEVWVDVSDVTGEVTVTQKW